MERQVSNGIYITDYRTQGTLFSEPTDPEVLPIQIKELENSIRHLIRSNIELTEALKEEDCEEYKEAISENKVVISRKQQQLKKLKENGESDFLPFSLLSIPNPSRSLPSTPREFDSLEEKFQIRAIPR